MGKPLTQLIIYLYKWVDLVVQSMWDLHVDFTAIICTMLVPVLISFGSMVV
jgi:hypothetical protein